MNPPPLPAHAFDPFDTPAGTIIRAAHEAIVMVDEQHRVVALNPAAQRMFGCAAADVLGRPLDRFIPPAARAAHASKVREFLLADAANSPMTCGRRAAAIRANGEEFPVEVTLSRVDATVEGVPRRYHAALLRDLSEEQALHEELHALQRRLRAVFELSPIAVWIADGEKIVFANRAAARLFGAEQVEALIGRSLLTLLKPESLAAVRTQIGRALAGDHDTTRLQGAVVRYDGGSREVEIAIAALPDHGHTTVQMVVADVTQQRRAAEEIERSRSELRRLSASVVEAREDERQRIARELHDELGQRLTALKLELTGCIADKRLVDDDARVAGMLAMLDETVASVRRIAADLRPLMLDDLGLNAAIEWLAHDASGRLGVAIRVHLGDADPDVDSRIAIAVYRMVQEALTNVARHARATEVDIELGQRGSELVLMVQDDGVGLPEGALQREGSFGLMGIRERAQMLGGRLEVDSPAEGGVRLTVYVPLARSAGNEAARLAVAREPR
jgi:two-component system, NarL family, sensor histidine kinase UhpB